MKKLSYNAKKRIGTGVSIGFIALMLIITYIPILILVVFSFTDSKTLKTWNGFSFELYAKMFTDKNILTALMNSLIIAGSASLIAMLIGTAAAVGIFYMKKYPKLIMNGISQITMINADIVTAIGFVLFFLVIQIPDGYATLIIAHTVICTPYVIMSVMPRLSQLNPNVYEAGLDLGANHMRTFLTVVMPQLVSGMISGFMLAFTISLDDFTITKFFKGSGIQTVPTYIYDGLTKHGIPNVLRALSTVLLVVVMAVLIIINVAAARREKKNKK